MKELSIERKSALKAYREEEDPRVRQLLENLFGSEFLNSEITDRIKTFEDALEKTGRPDVPEFEDLPEDWRQHFKALYKLTVIAEALNEGWEPNWSDRNEWKYWPWFIFDGARAGLACASSTNAPSCANANIGSRLCFKSEKLATYAGTQFIDIYTDYLLIK
jgi:hypothetical protein